MDILLEALDPLAVLRQGMIKCENIYMLQYIHVHVIMCVAMRRRTEAFVRVNVHVHVKQILFFKNFKVYLHVHVFILF